MSRLKTTTVLCALAGAVTLAACSPPPEPAFDVDAWRADVQRQTERMYWIHLRLDTASEEISKAEFAAEEGNTSAAAFHAAEAYRAVQRADEALLELGEQLQKKANLDQR